MYQYAGSPYASWQDLAWGGALVLTAFVLLISLVARAIISRHRVSND
jgi:phosphate transport system permease protein